MDLQADGRIQVMISPSLSPMHRLSAVLMLGAAVIAGTPATAGARVFVGVGVGVPFYGWGGWGRDLSGAVLLSAAGGLRRAAGYLHTAAASLLARPRGQPGTGQACYAGPYVCPMDRPVAPGSNCYCFGNSGQRVWGRSN